MKFMKAFGSKAGYLGKWLMKGLPHVRLYLTLQIHLEVKDATKTGTGSKPDSSVGYALPKS